MLEGNETSKLANGGSQNKNPATWSRGTRECFPLIITSGRVARSVESEIKRLFKCITSPGPIERKKRRRRKGGTGRAREVRTKERTGLAQLGRAEMKEGSEEGRGIERKRKKDVDSTRRGEKGKDSSRERALHRSREIAASFLGRQLITDIMF